MKYFGCIDQGTTSSRFIVFNDKGQIVASQQQELTQYLPNEVSLEHDPLEIWDSVKNCISKVDDEFSINQLDSIGITNQRETTLAWRKSTGVPLHNALVWQDTRTQDICDEIKQIEELSVEFIKTGLPLHITVKLWPSSKGDKSISVDAKARVSLPGFMLDIKGISKLAAPTPPRVIADNLIKSLLGFLLFDIWV